MATEERDCGSEVEQRPQSKSAEGPRLGAKEKRKRKGKRLRRPSVRDRVALFVTVLFLLIQRKK